MSGGGRMMPEMGAMMCVSVCGGLMSCRFKGGADAEWVACGAAEERGRSNPLCSIRGGLCMTHRDTDETTPPSSSLKNSSTDARGRQRCWCCWASTNNTMSNAITSVIIASTSATAK
eukprot:scaffold9055_cov90-Alexandrium_tamarense.AAC.1